MAAEGPTALGPPDDPVAPGHDAWRSLIGQVVAQFGPPDLQAAPSASWPVTVFEVIDARVTAEQAYVLIREWPSGQESWVGGARWGMYAMIRRPDGGFQVVGDKFVLIGSRRLPAGELIDRMASQLDADGLRELRALLDRTREPVQKEW